MNATTEVEAKEPSGRRAFGHSRNLASIGISVIALLASLVSLVWSQFLPARVTVYPNELAYLMTETDNLMSVHLALTFANTGARPAVVQKVALLLHPDSKSEGYLLQAAFFDGLENGEFTRASLAGPISVGAHQTEARSIRFLSDEDKPGDFLPLLVPGKYHGTVLVWTSPDDGPSVTAPFNFVLSDRNLKDLAEMRTGTEVLSVVLRRRSLQRWGARTLNEREMGELLARQ